MPSHPGQISFPGGKVETYDATPIDCALREAQEEIGLEPSRVEPLGYLDSYRTGTGFQITPVVAFVQPGFDPVLDPREVLEVFEVPLAFLMDSANHQKASREWRGRQRSFYAMPLRGRAISGARLPACSRTCTRGCFSDDPRRHRERPAVPAADRRLRRLCAADRRSASTRRRCRQRGAAGLAVRHRSAVRRRATLVYYATITPGGTPGQVYTRRA